MATRRTGRYGRILKPRERCERATSSIASPRSTLFFHAGMSRARIRLYPNRFESMVCTTVETTQEGRFTLFSGNPGRRPSGRYGLSAPRTGHSDISRRFRREADWAFRAEFSCDVRVGVSWQGPAGGPVAGIQVAAANFLLTDRVAG
jgi:hypothetical protein